MGSFGNLHVATYLGLERFPDKLESYCNRGPCDDVTIGQEGYKFVTYHSFDGRLEIYNPDDSLLGTIYRLVRPLGVFLDQSGHIYIAEYGKKKVRKY